ncbi:hypothetical protein [Auraticoccus monumenti]|uniref:Uncharacterized protein n=1 Tax=Auraticoccus monumenti TaxID=675864 RepID=A0A1G7C0W0_9ACTN|nr:hypothetical protein [Auraticoccus monumenti]SDE32952.1 hypothetical protein SAMN04489747_3128 [Auraticoccus monumenti]
MPDHSLPTAASALAALALAAALTSCLPVPPPPPPPPPSVSPAPLPSPSDPPAPLPSPSDSPAPLPSPTPVPPPVPDPPAPEPTPAPDGVVLTPRSLGHLTLDGPETLAVWDVEEAFDASGEFLYAGQTDECGLGTHEGYRVAVVMDSIQAVQAFVVENAEVVTQEGVALGSSTEDVVAAYGLENVYTAPVDSRAGGPLLVVGDGSGPPTEGQLSYAFDTDAAGEVTGLRAGAWPWIGYRDYCSDSAGRPEGTGWPLG